MGKWISGLVVVALMWLGASPAEAQQSAPANLVAGQIWSVKGSPMKVIIGRVEGWTNGRTAIHISVTDLPESTRLTVIDHLPFDAVVLRASLDRLVGDGAKPLDEFESGYGEWKAAKGGIFDISLAEVIALIVKRLPPPGAGRPAPI